MEATRTQTAGTRPVRSLVLVAFAFAILLAIAIAVGSGAMNASVGGQNVPATAGRIARPAPDPAARVHLRVAAGLHRMDAQGPNAGR